MNGLADWQSTQKNPLIDYRIVYTDTMYHSVFFRGSQAMIKKNASVYIDMGDALLSRRTLLEAILSSRLQVHWSRRCYKNE